MSDELLAVVILFLGILGGAVVYRAGVFGECQSLGVSYVGDYRLTCEQVTK